MKKILPLIALTCLLCASASATIRNVQVADFQFSPSSIPIVSVGDTIMWMWVSGSHTTTSTTVPAGAAVWDQPLNSTSTSFSYKVTVAGAYTYHCTPHASMGMTGSFTVQASTNVPATGVENAITIAPNPANETMRINPGDASGPLKLSIIDGLGRTILTLANDGKKSMEIPTGTFANGLYILHVRANGKDFSRAFEIKH